LLNKLATLLVPAFAITSETNDLRIEEHILDLQVLVKKKKAHSRLTGDIQCSRLTGLHYLMRLCQQYQGFNSEIDN